MKVYDLSPLTSHIYIGYISIQSVIIFLTHQVYIEKYLDMKKPVIHNNWCLLIGTIFFLFSEQATFSRDFASGYLVGEVLQKNGLQDDFDQFSQSK